MPMSLAGTYGQTHNTGCSTLYRIVHQWTPADLRLASVCRRDDCRGV